MKIKKADNKSITYSELYGGMTPNEDVLTDKEKKDLISETEEQNAKRKQ